MNQDQCEAAFNRAAYLLSTWVQFGPMTAEWLRRFPVNEPQPNPATPNHPGAQNVGGPPS
jgi:hypothetical protein